MSEPIPDEAEEQQAEPARREPVFNLARVVLVFIALCVIIHLLRLYVLDEEQDFDLSLMRMSAGVEMRIFVPVFGAPLRFIYASNLDPLIGDDQVFESFQFSIGATF